MCIRDRAENRSTVAEAHIQVDTGMGFGGFLVGEPEKILLAYRSLPNVALSGIYTQIHAAPAGQEMCIRDRGRASPAPYPIRSSRTESRSTKARPGRSGSSQTRTSAPSWGCLLYTSRCV